MKRIKRYALLVIVMMIGYISYSQTDSNSVPPYCLKPPSTVYKNIETDTGNGNYKITLGVVGGDTDKYPHLYGFFMDLQNATAVGATAGGALFQMKSQAMSTDGTVNIQMLNASGAVAHPTSGDHFHFTLILKNSNVPGTGV